MSKLSRKFLLWTFVIMIVCWGTCILCSVNGILKADNAWLNIPFILGGLSPTIASIIVTYKQKRFKGWLADIFDFKHNILMYLMVIALVCVNIFSQCLFSGYEKGSPLYMIILNLPIMLVGGGLEEAGWRYILQPELEKKYSFIVSTLIVAVIWWFWHLPLFYVPGVSQYGQSFLIFGIDVLGITFALAAIKRITSSTWLCVLFHCFVNSSSGVFRVNGTIGGSIAATAITIAVSLVFVSVNNKKKVLK